MELSPGHLSHAPLTASASHACEYLSKQGKARIGYRRDESKSCRMGRGLCPAENRHRHKTRTTIENREKRHKQLMLLG